VPLAAPLAASRLQAPRAVDFGLVPARELLVRQLPISNVGEAPLAFSWRVEAPFSLTPAAGRLAPGEGALCQVAFAPEDAAAFAGTAACELDNGEVVEVNVSWPAERVTGGAEAWMQAIWGRRDPC
jgi:hydrocephalus-inducing protein